MIDLCVKLSPFCHVCNWRAYRLKFELARTFHLPNRRSQSSRLQPPFLASFFASPGGWSQKPVKEEIKEEGGAENAIGKNPSIPRSWHDRKMKSGRVPWGGPSCVRGAESHLRQSLLSSVYTGLTQPCPGLEFWRTRTYYRPKDQTSCFVIHWFSMVCAFCAVR